jgi:D-alanyl-lipoteichoic acid acyltransferase DltB (MBOAT superfamily)
MIFQSLTYLFFLLIVLAIYWSLPRGAQNVLLVGASYIFYGWEHPWYLLPLWASTLVDYGCGLGMERFPARRRWFLVASVVASIALLGTFKYAGFAVENINAALTQLGFDPIRSVMRLVLPAGLSFYTFQSLAYIVDVYRGRVRAERNLLDYALYVCFFPQLIAGPIERAWHMLPQYQSQRIFDPAGWRRGLTLMLWGFFKKLVVADNVAVVANKVFALSDPTFPVIWVGVLAFAVQIYADFSGYTDIARGTARLLGIELMKNFNHPYLATSPADFWRRWHISFSTWLRDFIYIPLGGSRCGAARASFNLMATFAISGLWHGASWNYVLWGIYWGLLILAQRFLRWLGITRAIPMLLKIAITFGLTSFGWLLFRERNLTQIIHDLSQSPLAAGFDRWQIGLYLAVLILLYASPLIVHLIATVFVLPRLQTKIILPEIGIGSFAVQSATAILLFLGIIAARSVVTSDFIYFQF